MPAFKPLRSRKTQDQREIESVRACARLSRGERESERLGERMRERECIRGGESSSIERERERVRERRSERERARTRYRRARESVCVRVGESFSARESVCTRGWKLLFDSQRETSITLSWHSKHRLWVQKVQHTLQRIPQHKLQHMLQHALQHALQHELQRALQHMLAPLTAMLWRFAFDCNMHCNTHCNIHKHQTWWCYPTLCTRMCAPMRACACIFHFSFCLSLWSLSYYRWS